MKAFYSSVLLLAIVVTSTFAKQSDDEAWEEYKVTNLTTQLKPI